jgi:hypothetical protein
MLVEESTQFNSIRFILEVVQLLLHARLVAPATNANKHIQFRVVIGLVYTVLLVHNSTVFFYHYRECL